MALGGRHVQRLAAMAIHRQHRAAAVQQLLHEAEVATEHRQVQCRGPGRVQRLGGELRHLRPQQGLKHLLEVATHAERGKLLPTYTSLNFQDTKRKNKKKKLDRSLEIRGRRS